MLKGRYLGVDEVRVVAWNIDELQALRIFCRSKRPSSEPRVKTRRFGLSFDASFRKGRNRQGHEIHLVWWPSTGLEVNAERRSTGECNGSVALRRMCVVELIYCHLYAIESVGYLINHSSAWSTMVPSVGRILNLNVPLIPIQVSVQLRKPVR